MSGLTGSNSINQSGIVGGDSCIGSIATTTTGLISGGSLDIDNVLINGTTIGHTCDTDLLTVGNATLLAKGTVTVGVCATGHDVKFFGDTAGAYMLYDQSEDHLEIRGAAADAATSTGKLLLSTALTNINANDVIGSINFQAPLEAGGTDAITVAAGIRAVAQATFTCAVNATDLIFYTGHSEAATEKFRFTSQGEIGIGGANYGSDGQVLTSAGDGVAAAWEDAGGGGSNQHVDLATTATQSIGNLSVTALIFQGETTDTNTMHGACSACVTIKVAGTYGIHASTLFTGNSCGARDLYIYNGGTGIGNVRWPNTPIAGNFQAQINLMAKLAVDDALQFRVRQGSGGSLTTLNCGNVTRFQVTLLYED